MRRTRVRAMRAMLGPGGDRSPIHPNGSSQSIASGRFSSATWILIAVVCRLACRIRVCAGHNALYGAYGGVGNGGHHAIRAATTA